MSTGHSSLPQPNSSNLFSRNLDSPRWLPPVSRLTSLLCLKGPLEIQVVSRTFTLTCHYRLLPAHLPALPTTWPLDTEDRGEGSGHAPCRSPPAQGQHKTQAAGQPLESQWVSKAFPNVGQSGKGKTGRVECRCYSPGCCKSGSPEGKAMQAPTHAVYEASLKALLSQNTRSWLASGPVITTMKDPSFRAPKPSF